MCSIPRILIFITIFHPNVTSNSEDRVSKSAEDLIRTIPQSKDFCFFVKNESFHLDCNVKNPFSKGAWNRKLFVMGNQSVQQITERIPELKFKYFGSFPADFIPNLPKLSFAIIKTASSEKVGEPWILIARLNRNYYYADSLARSITHYKFLGKKYQKKYIDHFRSFKICVDSTQFCGISTI